jgi:glutathione S-transferase
VQVTADSVNATAIARANNLSQLGVRALNGPGREDLMAKKPAATAAKPKVATRAAAKAVPKAKSASSAKSKTMTLHGVFLSGPAYKVALGLSMMGQPYTFHHVDLRAGKHKAPEFMALNRYGQVPCLEDGKITLNQSASILLYLSEKTGKMAGKSAADKLSIREWMFWAFDRLNPNIFRPRAAARGFLQAHDEVLKVYTALGKSALDVIEAHLKGRDWIVGKSATVADIDLYGVVSFAGEGGYDLKAYPMISAWLKRFEGLKGWKPAIELMPPPQG